MSNEPLFHPMLFKSYSPERFVLIVLIVRILKLKHADKKYRDSHRETLREKWRQAYYRNPQKFKDYNKYYAIKNPEVKKAQYNRAHLKRMSKTNTRIKHNLRGRVWSALTGNKAQYKLASLKELIGCSIEDFKKHLESQFTEGMTWDNYGEWHVDHKKPCAAFDLTRRDQQLECFNFKNTQPLWAIDNLKKYAKH